MKTTLMLALALGLFGASPAASQEAPPAGFDTRWSPYLGCWKIVQEHLGQHPVPLAPGTQVCVKPSGRTGVAVTTTVDGKTVLEQTIVADGTPQAISQSDCSGTQTSDWSRSGERLFTRAEITCTGRPARKVSGITLLARGHWVDVQATVIDGNQDVRVRRYQRTGDQPQASAAIGAPFTIEDVIEASAKVQSEALEAAIDEAGGLFNLDSRRLKQLADNGVSANVIDLMVAQAFPEKFRVERSIFSGSSATASTWTGSSNTSIYAGVAPYPFADAYDAYFYNSFYYSPFAYPYYWGSYYGSRYGYPYYSRYNNFYYYGSPYGIWSGVGGVGGSVGTGGGGSAQPGGSSGGDGVAVRGRGYTRVRPGSSSDSGGSSDSTGGASRTRSGGGGVRGVDSPSSSSSDSSSSSSSPSSSSSGGASSGGYSSGGGGNSGGGRTAQPR